MIETILSPTIYACSLCGYSQDFDPYVPGAMAQAFSEYPGIYIGCCPTCYGRNVVSKLEATNENTIVRIAGDSELQQRTMAERNKDGSIVLKPTKNGDALTPLIRPINQAELRLLQRQRDADLERFSKG